MVYSATEGSSDSAQRLPLTGQITPISVGADNSDKIFFEDCGFEAIFSFEEISTNYFRCENKLLVVPLSFPIYFRAVYSLHYRLYE